MESITVSHNIKNKAKIRGGLRTEGHIIMVERGVQEGDGDRGRVEPDVKRGRDGIWGKTRERQTETSITKHPD